MRPATLIKEAPAQKSGQSTRSPWDDYHRPTVFDRGKAIERLGTEVAESDPLYAQVIAEIDNYAARKNTSNGSDGLTRAVKHALQNAVDAYLQGKAWESKLPSKAAVLALRYARGGTLNASVAGRLALLGRVDMLHPDKVTTSSTSGIQNDVRNAIISIQGRIAELEAEIEAIKDNAPSHNGLVKAASHNPGAGYSVIGNNLNDRLDEFDRQFQNVIEKLTKLDKDPEAGISDKGCASLAKPATSPSCSQINVSFSKPAEMKNKRKRLSDEHQSGSKKKGSRKKGVKLHNDAGIEC